MVTYMETHRTAHQHPTKTVGMDRPACAGSGEIHSGLCSVCNRAVSATKSGLRIAHLHTADMASSSGSHRRGMTQAETDASNAKVQAAQDAETASWTAAEDAAIRAFYTNEGDETYRNMIAACGGRDDPRSRTRRAHQIGAR